MQTIKRISQLGVVALAAFALATFASLFTNKVRAQLSPLRSFQVWYTEELSNNTVMESYYGRRSNGDTISKNLTTGTTVYDLASSGITVTASVKTDKIMTYGSGKSFLPQDFDPMCSGHNFDARSAETKTLLGFKVFHIQDKSSRTSAGGSVSEDIEDRWLAPDLNCYPLVDEFRFYTDGKQTAFHFRTATKASLTPPDDSQFVPPTGVEAPPSEFWPAIGRKALPQNEAAYKRDKAARSSIF